MIYGLPEKELFASGHSACVGCGSAIAMRLIMKAVDEKNIIVVNSTGCMEVVSTAYPHTAWKVPYIHCAFENAAAVASGIESALKMQNKKTKVIAIAGDGGTFDIGLQALSGAIERGHDFLYVCYDNNGYMNTGVQRSGATPKYAETTTTPVGIKIRGKLQFQKPMPFIIAAHRTRYVANANIAYPNDLYNKIKKGLETKGVSYVQIFCPCVPGWKYSSEKTVEVARLAVETKVCPLYEINDGIITITKKIENLQPVKNYLAIQGRFKHLDGREVEEIQKNINEEYNRLEQLEKIKEKI